MGFIHYMASQQGRSLRTAVGAVLVMLGLVGLHGTAEAIIILLGTIFIFVGVLDVCLLAPLFGKSFRGKDLRG